MRAVGSGAPLNPPERAQYVSLCMSLMFLARMTRADLLFPVTVASTRSSNATKGDMDNLLRILEYLAHVPNYGIQYVGGKAATHCIKMAEDMAVHLIIGGLERTARHMPRDG